MSEVVVSNLRPAADVMLPTKLRMAKAAARAGARMRTA